MDPATASPSIRQLLSRLATVKRREWTQRGIPPADCESMAEHAHGVAAYCAIYAPEALRAKATEMALVHDLADAVVADRVVPAHGVAKLPGETDDSRVRLALLFLDSLDPRFGARLRLLWQEYGEDRSEEARFVRDAATLQRLDRAFAYARRYPSLPLKDVQLDVAEIRNSILASQFRQVLEEWAVWERQRSLKYIFVIGGPGVGKGTQCSLAAAALPLAHVSAGELLRNEQGRAESRFRDFISQSFDQSIPVPPILIMGLLRAAVARSSREVVLLDGFPRSVEQLDLFENEVSSEYATVYLAASEETLEMRLRRRALSSGRPDDEEAKIQQRIKAATSSSTAILRRLERQPIYTIDSEGPIDEVQKAFRDAVQTILQRVT